MLQNHFFRSNDTAGPSRHIFGIGVTRERSSRSKARFREQNTSSLELGHAGWVRSGHQRGNIPAGSALEQLSKGQHWQQRTSALSRVVVSRCESQHTLCLGVVHEGAAVEINAKHFK
jgi:hypothetical protein